MQWEKDASEAIDRVPFFVRRMARRKVEEMVAEEGRRAVTLADVRRARDRQMASTPQVAAPPEPASSPTTTGEPSRVELSSGLTAEQIRNIEQLADTLASHEARFYSVKACGGAAGCPLTLVDVAAITKRVVEAIQESGLENALADRHRGPVLSHHKFKAAVAGCPNSCSEPQIKDFALVARSYPTLTGATCTHCLSCQSACSEGAITVGDAGPEFDSGRCVGCGGCAEACSSDVIESSRRGYDVLVGGRLGRHPRLALRVAEGVPEDQAMMVLRRCLDVLRADGLPGERLAQLVDRLGLDRLRLTEVELGQS